MDEHSMSMENRRMGKIVVTAWIDDYEGKATRVLPADLPEEV
jgi:hypothetical protein